jgi:hypothetical protein
MDERRPDLRVADRDRHAAAERLRLALGEGRLDLVEYDDRLAKAYAAVTYSDLEPLFTDLPPSSAMAEPVAPPRPVLQPAPRPTPAAAHMPTALKVLWTIWVAVVSINVTVWLIVSVTTGLTYFWPVWLAVPGAALFAVSAGVLGMRGNPPPRPPLPPSDGPA